MHRFMRLKALAHKVKEVTHEIVTGEKRRAAKKLKQDIREHAHVRAGACEECLGSLSSLLNDVTTEKKS